MKKKAKYWGQNPNPIGKNATCAQGRNKKGQGKKNPYIPIFQIRKEEIQELLREGKNPYVIAKEYKLSWQQVWKYGKDIGIKVLTKIGMKKEKRDNKIKASFLLYTDNEKMVFSKAKRKAIAKKFKITPERVRQILKGI